MKWICVSLLILGVSCARHDFGSRQVVIKIRSEYIKKHGHNTHTSVSFSRRVLQMEYFQWKLEPVDKERQARETYPHLDKDAKEFVGYLFWQPIVFLAEGVSKGSIELSSYGVERLCTSSLRNTDFRVELSNGQETLAYQPKFGLNRYPLCHGVERLLKSGNIRIRLRAQVGYELDQVFDCPITIDHTDCLDIDFAREAILRVNGIEVSPIGVPSSSSTSIHRIK